MYQEGKLEKITGDGVIKDLDLVQFILIILNGKWLILGISFFFALSSIIYSLSIPNEFKAELVLVATNQTSKPQGLSQLASLTNMSGISLGKEASEQTVAIEVMESWGFVDKFIEDNNLQIYLAAVKGWEETNNSLKINTSIYDEKNKTWLRKPSGRLTSEPTSWELYKLFTERFNLFFDSKTGLIEISFEYLSPYLAVEYLEIFVSAINQHMRDRKIQMSNANIKYLQIEINKTNIGELKSLLYQMMTLEIQSKMLAEASPEYMFTVVSSAQVPEKKSKPTRSLIVIVSTVAGFALSIFIILIHHLWRLRFFSLRSRTEK